MRARRPFAVSPEEQALIKSALGFANLTAISSTEEVENLFRKNVPLVGDVFQVIEPENRAAFERDQRELQGWLAKIVKSTTARKSVMQEIPKRLATVHTQVSFGDGKIRLQFALPGVQACYSYAVALILDERRKLTGKLAQCGWSGCKRFRLDFSPAGRPRKYCNPKHKSLAEAESRRLSSTG